MTMQIRKLRPGDDLFAVSRVYEESWREAYRGLLPQEYLNSIPLGKWVPYLEQAGRESLLLLKGEKIVGTASCCASRTPELAGWGEIVFLYLLPEYWGNGWGKALLSAAVKQLESMGYRDLFLWVLEGNQRARAFYECMGFRPSGAYTEDEIGGMPVRTIYADFPSDRPFPLPGGAGVANRGRPLPHRLAAELAGVFLMRKKA